MNRNELVTRQAPGSSVPGVPVRATRVASWIGWHLFEITGVTVPAVCAVSVSPWWWLVSGAIGAGWTANEIRVTQTSTSGADRRHQVDSAAAAVTTTAGPGETFGVDGKRVGGVW